MIEIENQTKYNFYDEVILNHIKNEFTNKFIELIITNNETIKNINNKFRNINKATDVLSFPMEDIAHSPLGSIVISIDKVIEKSQELNHSEKDEFTLLFIHGLLHLLKFDHEIDNGEMRIEEEKIVKKYNLPESLIVRN